MAVAGGFAGKGLGMLVFGPAGAYVFGGVGALAAATKGNWIAEWVDVALNPDRDRAYDDAAKHLLLNCIGHLEAKVIGIESKVDALPDGEIADAMRFRWQWELIFVKSKINEADHLQQSGTKSGERKAVEALELAYNCGVHPIWLQKNYTELLSLLSEPKNRLVNVKKKWGQLLKSMRRKNKSLDDPNEIANNLIRDHGLDHARQIAANCVEWAKQEGDNNDLSFWCEVVAILNTVNE
jgi:hypothetical protein